MMNTLMGVMENYGIYPLVFNVYELLKQKLRVNKAPAGFQKTPVDRAAMTASRIIR